MRVLRTLGLSLLAIVLLVALALGAILASEAVGRWLLGQVPGLEVTEFQGRLGGSWQARQIVWADGGNRVELQEPVLSWSPACLLRATLCIDRLKAQRVDMAFAPSDAPADTSPVQLPVLRLPIGIEVGTVEVGQLRLDGNDLLGDLQLAAHWTTTGLRIDRLQVHRDDLHLALQGNLLPEGDWPLQLDGQLQLPAVEGQAWQLAVTAKGDLQRTLELDASSTGYLNARLTGELQALAEHLPAKLHVRSEAFKPAAALPDTVQLNQLKLDAEGDLLKGYQLTGSASLPAEQAPVSLVLAGRVDAKGARLDALDLSASETQRLKLSATADWQNALQADAQLDWLDFPWLRLYPLETPPEVSLKHLDAQVH